MSQFIFTGVGIFGLISAAVAIVVSLSQREVRKEAAEYQDKRINQLHVELEDERQACDRKLKAMQDEVSLLTAKVNVLTSDLSGKLGDKIGDRIAVTVLRRLRDGA